MKLTFQLFLPANFQSVRRPRRKQQRGQVEPPGRKGRWDVTSHICDHYQKRQDIKSIQAEEVEEIQVGKRKWDRENPSGKTGKKHLRAQQLWDISISRLSQAWGFRALS